MKKTSNLCSFLCGVLVSVILVSTAAASVNTKKMIEANYRDIKLVVDGIEVTPKDASGNVVEPFISAGTTYLPVRAVAEALGKDVAWDGETKTVYVGKVPGTEENWVKKLPPYQWTNDDGHYGTGLVQVLDGSDHTNYISVAGVKYKVGYVFSRGSGSSIYPLNAYAVWNTNAEYKTMTFTVGGCDGNQKDCRIDVYLDGEFSTSYDVSWAKPAQTINVPLNYAASVRLQFVGERECAYGMYDVSFS